MWQRSHKIIVVLAFLNISATLNAQEYFLAVPNKQWPGQYNCSEKMWIKFSPILAKKTTFIFLSEFKNDRHPEKSFFAPAIIQLYMRGLGFICRQELKLDQLSAVKIRLRLGSLDYVNRLEGKSHEVGYH